MASGISAISIAPYYNFKDCCTNEQFNFRGTIPGFVNNTVYLSSATVGGLIEGRCYTVIQLTSQDSVFWNSLPIIASANVSKQGNTCSEAAGTGKCVSCEEPCGECPEGYIQVGNECVKQEIVPAIYTGGLVTITEGATVTSYNKFGLRLYPDISSEIKPLLGSSNPYEVKANNGAGATITPLILGLQSTLWGCELPAACSTFVGPVSSYGGRLNIAGIWAPGYNVEEGDGPELGFDFCVDITETKQYLVGIAGDNKVKLYVDGVLNVFLEPGGAGATATFNYWHVFPITLNAGQHIIRLAGINIGNTQAAFAGEIYDIDVTTFQANLTDPAVGIGNCGNTPADLEPYIVFTTRDFIGEDIPNPTQPGVWECPDGSNPDYCTGIPQCTVEEKIAFPICPCYLLLPCDEGQQPIISNTAELSNYLNGYVSVIPQDQEDPICVYVADFVGEEVCESGIDVSIVPETFCECAPQCYYISGAEGVVYVSTDDELIELSESETFPYLKVCSKTYPLTSNINEDYQIITLGECIDEECPLLCFKLVNCADNNIVIYSNSDSLLPYLYGTENVVNIIGQEGCWTVQNLDEEEVCDCPIDIVVTASYSKCEDCIGYIAYRLIACTGNDVIYTLLNLEEYIGQVVKLDCGCYKVEQINYLPSNPQTIKLEDVFTTCTECQRTYWELTDCAGIAEPIITYTDLSVYAGKTIKIKDCDECWEVNPTEEHLNATTVVVINSYDDCIECGIPTVCNCTKVTNLNEVEKTYVYYDCDGISHSITLQPGESSDKVCSLYWVAESPVCTCIQFIIKEQSYYAFIVPNQLFNDKPFYNLCTLGEVTDCGYVYWDGNNWLIADSDNNITHILINPTSESCPYGDWAEYNQEVVPRSLEPIQTKAAVDVELISQECDLNICSCITLTLDSGGTSTFYVVAIDIFGNPVYSDGLFTIEFQPKSNCWVYGLENFRDPYYLCGLNLQCPIGNWESESGSSTAVSVECPVEPTEFTVFDHFETFGECQYGVCPPPVFKNNRTVKPGYNTPNCNPDEYDKITCKFADVYYKIALEKRYGITNCCPEEDEKWLLKKELIDLQALKDPNYPCSDCPCACNSGKTYSSCNCGN